MPRSRKKVVIVYILTSNPSSHCIRILTALFKCDLFEIRTRNIPASVGTIGTPSFTSEQITEAHRVNEVLTEASRSNPDNYVIVMKDSCVTNSDVKGISRTVLAIIEEGGWDLCYLCTWLDRCDLYKNARSVDGTCTKIVRTFSPNGVQAIMFSPCGRDIIIGKKTLSDGSTFTPINKPLGTQLNEFINKEKIIALCTVPNMFEYDILLSESVSDLAKLSTCRRPENNGITSGPGILPFTWFLVITLGVIILAWAFYYLVPRKRFDEIA